MSTSNKEPTWLPFSTWLTDCVSKTCTRVRGCVASTRPSSVRCAPLTPGSRSGSPTHVPQHRPRATRRRCWSRSVLIWMPSSAGCSASTTLATLKDAHRALDPLYEAKLKFVRREATKLAPAELAGFDPDGALHEIEAWLGGPFDELAFARAVLDAQRTEADGARIGRSPRESPGSPRRGVALQRMGGDDRSRRAAPCDGRALRFKPGKGRSAACSATPASMKIKAFAHSR
ncbi:MAG: hypothetical protein U1E89_06705 [Burkholderiaceae bacterium]